MSGHTPGPWEAFFYVRNQRLNIGDWSFSHGNEHHPLPLRHTKKDQREASANARLIAAAPELLAALKDLMELYANGQVVIEGDEGNDPVVGAAWAAIDKAEGRGEE